MTALLVRIGVKTRNPLNGSIGNSRVAAQISTHKRAATPPAFRDVLLSIASSACTGAARVA